MSHVLKLLASRNGPHAGRALPYAPGRVKMQSERATVIKSRIDESEMKAAFIISTPAEDRTGEVVLTRGCIPTLSTYQANPVVHLNHRTQEHPIALSETYHGEPGIDVFEDRIEAVAAFHGKTELSAQTWELTVLGVYKGASIGFRPLLAQREEIEATPEDYMVAPDEIVMGRKGYRLVFRRWELVEWSVTGVPCNQDAVISADYRDLVTRTLGRGTLDGGRKILPAIRADLSPFALRRKSWAVAEKAEFREEDHPRADDGKFGEGGGSHGGGKKPSEGGSFKPAGPTQRAAIEEYGHVAERPRSEVFNAPHRLKTEEATTAYLESKHGKDKVSATYAPGAAFDNHTALWVGDNMVALVLTDGKGRVRVSKNGGRTATIPEGISDDEAEYRIRVTLGGKRTDEEKERWGDPKDWKARDEAAKSFREEDHPRADDGKFGDKPSGEGGSESGGGSRGSGGKDPDSPSPSSSVKEADLPQKARSRLAKLRDALSAAGSAAAHPSRTAKKAVAAARAKLKAMHEKYGTTGTVLILGAAVVATPIPVPGATPVAVWAVSKLLSVLGLAKKDEGKSWLTKGDDPEELSEEEAERLGREFVEEFLAGCGLGPDLESLEGEDVEENDEKAVQSILVPHPLAGSPEQAALLIVHKGLDTSVVEETPEGWLFRQAESCDCHPGVVCDEDGCRVVRGPICQCDAYKGKVFGRSDNPAREKAMSRKQDDDERPHGDDERPVQGEGDDEDVEGEEQAEEIREKAALKAGAMWLKGHRAYCKACEESVEHAGVLKTARRALRYSARTARKYYGENYKDMGYEDADDGGAAPDDDEEDDDRSEKPSDEEKAIADAFNKVMQELLGTKKNYARELTRNNGHR